jgi:hypothetical protein
LADQLRGDIARQRFRRFANAKVKCPRFIVWNDFAHLNLREHFQTLHLFQYFDRQFHSGIGTLGVFPDLCRLFYANIVEDYSNDELELHTRLFGREIHITSESISDLLAIPNEGNDFNDILRQYDPEVINQELVLSEKYVENLGTLPYKNLKPLPRLLSRIFWWDLLNKSGGFDYISR